MFDFHDTPVNQQKSSSVYLVANHSTTIFKKRTTIRYIWHPGLALCLAPLSGIICLACQFANWHYQNASLPVFKLAFSNWHSASFPNILPKLAFCRLWTLISSTSLICICCVNAFCIRKPMFKVACDGLQNDCFNDFIHGVWSWNLVRGYHPTPNDLRSLVDTWRTNSDTRRS